MSARAMLAFSLGALVACVALVGVLFATGEIGEDEKASADPASTPAPAPRAAAGAPVSVADIYARVSSGVVFIAARGGGEVPAVPGTPPGGNAATGSGFLIDGDGSIITNDHVVGGAGQITVRFGEGEPVSAQLRGRDPSSDIALLLIDPDEIPERVQPVELASSKGLRPGDAAIAIGSPFGLSGTVTSGIISALDREIPAPNNFTISGVLQTDAAINPGNSGGPLLDAGGRAIGVNSQIATGGSNQSSGVGFAVPIDTVKQIVPELKRGGVVARAWLGVTTSEAPAGDGAVVGGVVRDGPADRAGIRPGDVIVSIAGKPVNEPGDVGAVINERKPDDRVEVEVRRGAERRPIQVELGERPQEAAG